ncbi:MAG TPA: hypothetical protein VE891_11190 [Allosphingosinicella sp.]|nr:hypothetical protein [Allosphingosinicella sp.]
MQSIINDAVTVIVVCLAIAVVVSALVVFRPWKRRQRQRRRHSRRPKIDLLGSKAPEPTSKVDA